MDITVTLSSNVTVRDVIIFGYRQNSDGIAMVDTQHALIEDCFIRSGDDLFEVKSMYSDSPSGGNDIVYRNCVAWADQVPCIRHHSGDQERYEQHSV